MERGETNQCFIFYVCSHTKVILDTLTHQRKTKQQKQKQKIKIKNKKETDFRVVQRKAKNMLMVSCGGLLASKAHHYNDVAIVVMNTISLQGSITRSVGVSLGHHCKDVLFSATTLPMAYWHQNDIVPMMQ